MDVVAMPQLGETVTEGTIIRWSKAVGDRVEVDDALFEVSTEKVDTEVPSATAGWLRAILVPDGDTVAVGVPVGVLTETEDEPVDLDAIPGGAASGHLPPADRSGSGEDGTHVGGARDGGAGDRPAVRAERGARGGASAVGWSAGGPGGIGGFLSPAVRRLLAEHGLEPGEVVGSGRDGRITRADVLAAAANRLRPGPGAGVGGGEPGGRTGAWPVGSHADPGAAGAPSGPGSGPGEDGPGSVAHAPGAAAPRPAAPSPSPVQDGDEIVELSRARLATAEHLSRSLATAAHALVTVAVDYANVDRARRGTGLSYLPFVARALVEAVAEHPHVNASLDGDRLAVHRHVNLGVAVDLDGEALVVPVLREAEGLRLRAVAAGVADLAERARRKRLPAEAFAGGTITLTNVGRYGTVVAAPIINQPQVAILSTDGVRMTPVAVRTDPGAASARGAGPGGDGEATWGVAVRPVGNLSLSFDHRAFDGAYAASFLARVRDVLEARDWQQEVAS